MNIKRSLLTVSLLTLAIGFAVNGYSQSFLTNGLVAYYPFNGNADDASGNGNNGFAENTFTTTNQFGQPNSALGFAGNSWVYVPYSASLFTTNYTVSIMFNCQTPFANVCIIKSGNAATDPWRGYSISERDLWQNFGFGDDSGTGESATCVTPIGDWLQNKWYNLTFTRSGTTAQLYLNGVLVVSQTDTPPYAPPQNSPLYIGANSHDPTTTDPTAIPSSGFFTGIIYDVRLYDRGLSSNEVTQLYATELQPQVGIVKAVRPSFSSLAVGANYQLQVSADLNTWTNQASVFTATNTSMVYPQYWDVDNWNQLFFRLQVAP